MEVQDIFSNKFNEETDDGGRKKEKVDGGFIFVGAKIFYNSRIPFGGGTFFWRGKFFLSGRSVKVVVTKIKVKQRSLGLDRISLLLTT